MILGYVRVSTIEQNEERQLVTMQKYNVGKVYSEKVSAKDTNRPQLQALLKFARKGDTIVIHDFSRLARSTKDLLEIVENLQEKGVKLISAKESLDISTPGGKLMLSMLASIYEFERANMLERQKEGIAIAKEKHLYDKKPIKNDKLKKYVEMIDNKQITKIQASKELNISRVTLDKLIKEYKQA